MTFREAFLQAAEKNRKIRIRRLLMNRLLNADPERPLVKRHWERMEARVMARYKADTGGVVTDFGDGQFLDWLIANWPAILEMIMQIIALFAVV